MIDIPTETYWKEIAAEIWHKVKADDYEFLRDSMANAIALKLKRAYDKGAEDERADISAKIDAIAELDDLP